MAKLTLTIPGAILQAHLANKTEDRAVNGGPPYLAVDLRSDIKSFLRHEVARARASKRDRDNIADDSDLDGIGVTDG